MKTNKYLLFPIIILFLTSCYIYKPYSEKEIIETEQNNINPQGVKSIRQSDQVLNPALQKTKGANNQTNSGPPENDSESLVGGRQKKPNTEQEKEQPEDQNKGRFASADGTVKNTTAEPLGSKKGNEKDPKPVDIKTKLQPNKYYKIIAFDHQYKIQVDKWEGDTLISHKVRKPSKQYKFHKDDIQEGTILERRFSKPFSDLLTVGAYASGAAIVLLLIL